MLNIFIISLFSIFAAAGIYFLLREFISHTLKNNEKSCVILHTPSEPGKAEFVIRSALRANPDSTILVITKEACDETDAVLTKLSADTKRIHIIKAPKQ